jgi:C4-dicarboxylate-specific signal transduction histidine kinase
MKRASRNCVGALMDVTAAKQAQEALQIAQNSLAHVTRVTMLGEMTTSIAHEVNQPLGAIVTNAGASLRWLGRQPPEIEEVRGAIEQIVNDAHRNLLVNGMEAMATARERERVLIVRTQRHQADEVLVAIEDAGVGIKPENADRLFSAFY